MILVQMTMRPGALPSRLSAARNSMTRLSQNATKRLRRGTNLDASARVHFSVLYLSQECDVGVFIVHAMRQGGPHQTLRTNLLRALIGRACETPPSENASAGGHRQERWPAVETYAGRYRPLLLSTTTVERAAELVMESTARVRRDGVLRLSIPAGPDLDLERVAVDHFRVREGPEAGLHVQFIDGRSGEISGFAMSGNTQDPVSFERLRWFESGRVHALLLACTGLLFAVAPLEVGLRALARRIKKPMDAWPAEPATARWARRVVVLAGTLAMLAPAATVLLVLADHGDDRAADALRRALAAGLTLLLAAAVVAVLVPVFAVIAWRWGYWGPGRRSVPRSARSWRSVGDPTAVSVPVARLLVLIRAEHVKPMPHAARMSSSSVSPP